MHPSNMYSMWPHPNQRNINSPSPFQASALPPAAAAAGYGQTNRLQAAVMGAANPYQSMVAGYPGASYATDRTSVANPNSLTRNPSVDYSMQKLHSNQFPGAGFNYAASQQAYADIYRQNSTSTFPDLSQRSNGPLMSKDPLAQSSAYSLFQQGFASESSLLSGINPGDYGLSLSSALSREMANSASLFESTLQPRSSHLEMQQPSPIPQQTSQQASTRRNSHGGSSEKSSNRHNSDSFSNLQSKIAQPAPSQSLSQSQQQQNPPSVGPPSTADQVAPSPRQPHSIASYHSPAEHTPQTPKTPRVVTLSDELRQLASIIEKNSSPASTVESTSRDMASVIEKLTRMLPSSKSSAETQTTSTSEDELFIVDSAVKEFCLTVPRELVIKASKAPQGGIRLGVWGREEIPAASEFGPFKGRLRQSGTIVPGTADDHWLVKSLRSSSTYYFLPDSSNPPPRWMMFINSGCSEIGIEPNCFLLYQSNDEYIIRVMCSIQPQNEVLICVNEDLLPSHLVISPHLESREHGRTSSGSPNKKLTDMNSEDETRVSDHAEETDPEVPLTPAKKGSKSKKKKKGGKSRNLSPSAIEPPAPAPKTRYIEDIPFFIAQFACRDCCKYYVECSAYETHRKSYHEDNMPWRCKLCDDTAYKELGKLKAHCKKEHDEEDKVLYFDKCRNEAIELGFQVDFEQDLSEFVDYELFSGSRKLKSKRKITEEVESKSNLNDAVSEDHSPVRKKPRSDSENESAVLNDEGDEEEEVRTKKTPKRDKSKSKKKKGGKKKSKSHVVIENFDDDEEEVMIPEEVMDEILEDLEQEAPAATGKKRKKSRDEKKKKGKSKSKVKQPELELSEDEEEVAESPPASPPPPVRCSRGRKSSNAAKSPVSVKSPAARSPGASRQRSPSTSHSPRVRGRSSTTETNLAASPKRAPVTPVNTKPDVPSFYGGGNSGGKDLEQEIAAAIGTGSNTCSSSNDIKSEPLESQLDSESSDWKRKPEKKFECQYCSHKCIMVGSFERHMSEVHGISEPWKCEECDASFGKYSQMLDHARKHVDGEDEDADAGCGNNEPTPPAESLSQVMSTGLEDTSNTLVSEQPQLSVSIPSSSTCIPGVPSDYRVNSSLSNGPSLLNVVPSPYTKIRVTEQEQRHSDDSERGTEEDQAPGTALTATGRKRRSKVARVFTCDQCDPKTCFTQAAKYGRHLLEKHNIAKPWRCETCNKTFSSLQAMENHQKKCTTENVVLRCDKCNIEIKSMKLFTLHMSGDHSSAVPYTCQLCGYSFPRESVLGEHMRSTHGVSTKDAPAAAASAQMVTAASIAPSPFPLLNSVSSSEKCPVPILPAAAPVGVSPILPKPPPLDPSSSGEALDKKSKQTQCQICFKFMDRNYFQDHMNLHNGNRPYECDLCQQRFAQRAGLGYHKRTHHQLAAAPVMPSPPVPESPSHTIQYSEQEQTPAASSQSPSVSSSAGNIPVSTDLVGNSMVSTATALDFSISQSDSSSREPRATDTSNSLAASNTSLNCIPSSQIAGSSS